MFSEKETLIRQLRYITKQPNETLEEWKRFMALSPAEKHKKRQELTEKFFKTYPGLTTRYIRKIEFEKERSRYKRED